MTHVTCKLTAKNRDRLRNPTLGNRVWATFLNYCVKQVSVDPPRITAMTLPARYGALAPATDMDRKAAATDGKDRRTDGRTPERYVDPARQRQ